ncbi:MAG TPA: aspartate aminotransferase family protein [Bacteroidia bacterium]|nr:aspartate aminotransferase family protein [Bacteroidia bacterium]
MHNNRQLFLHHNAQTTFFPLLLEMERAAGTFIWDVNGKRYFDLISGIAVSNVGHGNKKVIDAITNQVQNYMHLMVYGEYVQSPQVQFAKKLCEILPLNLQSVYFVNSGAEAVDGALKLAKRFTGRFKTISCKNAYHGSSQGVLSVMGNEAYKQAYRPLIPGNKLIEFGKIEDLKLIDDSIACVVIETVQGEAGVRTAEISYFKALIETCKKYGVLLILDEIQCGMGRTGKMFAFEHVGIVPDILCLSKSLGGGMPLGAFISSKEIMQTLAYEPMLGHITTFGGHPVCCAAGLAALEYTLENNLIALIEEKERLFRSKLLHPQIKDIRGLGLLLALQFDSFETNKKIIDCCIKNGLISDWFLFCDDAMRIAPPLIISKEEIEEACEIILKSIDEILV